MTYGIGDRFMLTIYTTVMKYKKTERKLMELPFAAKGMNPLYV